MNESLPAAPPGYTFGTPTFIENSGEPNDGIVTITSNGATVEVTTVNTLTRDLGSLTLSKVLSGGPAGYAGPFTINYDCNDGAAHDGSKSVAAGATSSPITGIPTGTQCTISETPPSAPGRLCVRHAVVLAVRDGDDLGEEPDGQRPDHQHVDAHNAASCDASGDAHTEDGYHRGEDGDAAGAAAAGWRLGPDYLHRRGDEQRA